MVHAAKTLKPEIAAMVAAARSAVKSGDVKVTHIPRGQRGVSLTPAQWDLVSRGEKKVSDFAKKKGRPRKAA